MGMTRSGVARSLERSLGYVVLIVAMGQGPAMFMRVLDRDPTREGVPDSNVTDADALRVR